MRLSGLLHPISAGHAVSAIHPVDAASLHPQNRRLRLLRILALILLGLSAAMWAARAAAQQQSATSLERESLHETELWRELQSHLPDPNTASAQALELEADILRARRFPEDAMDFYHYAMARGGNMSELWNKVGLTELELRNVELARACFNRAVKTNKRDASAWNNMGAVEYLDSSWQAAVSDYKRAIKLEKGQAVFHSNLATAYFGTKDYGGARREMATALRLDPHVFDRQDGTGGVEAHVLTSKDRARFAYEMAKLFARGGDQEQMLHSLAMASEAGMDVQREMHRDLILAQFENDPRVVVLVHNAQMMRAAKAGMVSAQGTVPAPPAAKPMME
jgi:tetratricopeptide (TPR) repeat protein